MFLIIETATAKGLIALSDGDRVVHEKELVLGLANSRLLEPALHKLMNDAGVKVKDLEYVAVGRGPGSYTGLRVGAACAKALSIGSRIPLVGISSLRGYLPPVDFRGNFLVAIDAKTGGVYVQEGRVGEDGVSFIGEEKLVPFDEFVALVRSIPYVATPAWAPLAKRLEGQVLPTVFETGPSAKQLLQEARKNFIDKVYSVDGTLELRYLRLTQAEIEKKQ